jgi:hypothetical protein
LGAFFGLESPLYRKSPGMRAFTFRSLVIRLVGEKGGKDSDDVADVRILLSAVLRSVAAAFFFLAGTWKVRTQIANEVTVVEQTLVHSQTESGRIFKHPEDVEHKLPRNSRVLRGGDCIDFHVHLGLHLFSLVTLGVQPHMVDELVIEALLREFVELAAQLFAVLSRPIEIKEAGLYFAEYA